MATVTDTEIRIASQMVLALYKAALTRAERSYKRAVEHAFAHFGPTDVEIAARGNVVRRAEIAYGDALVKAVRNRNERLDDIRARAGAWADLVPGAIS